MSLVPTAIIDKNGKHTTVHRKTLSSTKKSLPTTTPTSQHKIKQGGYIGLEILLEGEVNFLERVEHEYIRKLAEATGWDMYGVKDDDKNQAITYLGLAVKTPEGLFIDRYGIYTEQEWIEREGHERDIPQSIKITAEDKQRFSFDVDKFDRVIDLDIVVAKVYKAVKGTELYDWEVNISERETVVFNGTEIPIASPEHSPLSCGECGTFYPLKAEDTAWQNGYNLECQSCGFITYMGDADCAILESSVKFLDEEGVRSHTWFHSSKRPNWQASLATADFVVHLGTQEAAEDRLRHINNGLKDEEFFLYEVKLKDNIEISAPLYDDNEGYQPQTIDALEDAEMSSTGVNRYLNLYENAGSISLMANPRAFEVINVTKI